MGCEYCHKSTSTSLINIPAAKSPTTTTNGTAFDAKFDAVFGNQPSTSQNTGNGCA